MSSENGTVTEFNVVGPDGTGISLLLRTGAVEMKIHAATGEWRQVLTYDAPQTVTPPGLKFTYQRAKGRPRSKPAPLTVDQLTGADGIG